MSDSYEADLGDELDDVEETEDELDEDEETSEDDTEVEETDEEEEPEPQARQPSRGDLRVAKATRDAAEAKRRADALEAELATLKANQNRQPSESVAQRQARLDEMEPSDRRLYLLEEREANREFQTNERLDKMSFDALCARNPQAARYAADVERELTALRGRGQNVDRETMLKYVIGEKLLASASRATGRATKKAAVNRERQIARPGNARGDVPATDRRAANSKAARDKRLEDFNI